MKIISYNLNGIRSAINKGLYQWIESVNADIICMQEIRIDELQLDLDFFKKLNYNSYWFSAEKKGYSGVGILSKKKALHIEKGIGINDVDREGRVIRIDLEELSIMSVYVPSATNMDRLEFKMNFLDHFQKHVDDIKKTHPNLLVCGDYNICHKAIDIHNPIANKNTSGFLPEERMWLDQFINSGFVDSFRHFVKEPHNYTWWSYRANSRNNNKGWRIDYHLVSDVLAKKMSRAYILSDVKHSDHCPVVVEFDF
ncbi:exodeoxyribonuclease III [Ichthyobacterium seriolicida]|uniref:Exodeoxyribonuclease III n=1 Tax=Ichthyobacterium seriolicida TaxID=242600 RepID=A0A1J1E2Y7_9FLAO|nr:exodeoxyribonuclease III [Ichthyobacterium seriolicida]BAV95317.1 exodeoxyribonuclease III [Ichthyobacterium seriolicida]